MRFRLRTLLIAITIACVALARFSYLKKQRDIHRHELQKHVSQLAEYGFTPEGTYRWLEQTLTLGPDSNHGGLESRTAARQQAIIVQRYERAMYRPWTSVWDDPNSVPDRIFPIDWRFCAAAGITVGLAFGIGSWLENRRRRYSAIEK